MSKIIDVDFNSAKPVIDKKEYRLIQLPSGLEVLLISTKNLCESRGKESMDTAKSAASMLIQCGSFADPVNVAEGVAHFIEHMVFMGSEKYPVENHYDSFIQSHGGNCNAFTEGEYTVYQFDVNNDYFAESLDIFANCFISPLLTMAASDREIKAIESEFQLAVSSDSSRCQQLFLQDTIKDHPVRVFGWGNKKSLSDIPNNLGVNMQSILKGFYDTHFRPENMKLVVLSSKILDEIQSDVEKSFLHWNIPQAIPHQITINSKSSTKKINKKNEKKINLLTMDQVVNPFIGINPFDKSKLSILTRVIPIKNTHNISIYWAIPGQVPSYKTKAGEYISHLCGHEGPGSLLSNLKAKDYGTSVAAGVSTSNNENNSMFYLFAIHVNLTGNGLSNWITVVEMVYDYLKMLKTQEPQEWIFNEYKKLAEVTYNFLDEQDEADFVEEIACCMAPYREIDRIDLLSCDHLYWKFDPNTINSILAQLIPSNCRIDLLSSSFSQSNGKSDHINESPKKKRKMEEDLDMDEDDDEEDDDDDDNDEDEDDEDDNDEDDNDEDDNDEENEGDDNDEDDNDEDNEGDEDDKNKKEEVINLTPDQIKDLYKGPMEWIHLILPPSTTPLLEVHFGTSYWTDKLPNDLIELFNNPNSNSNFKFPLPNPFIPDNLTVLKPNNSVVTSESIVTFDTNEIEISSISITSKRVDPVIIRQEDGLVVWHKIDPDFPVPKVVLRMRILSPIVPSSLEASVKLDLCLNIFSDYINEMSYIASMADLDSSINLLDTGISFRVWGFSSKASLFLEQMITSFLSPDKYIITSSYKREIEKLEQSYLNATMKAEKAARNARLTALKPSKRCPNRKLSVLRSGDITLESLSIYMMEFFSNICVDMFVYGNISSHETIIFSEKIESIYNSCCSNSSMSAKNRPEQLIIKIPTDQAIIYTVAPRNLLDKNICVEFYYQLCEYDIVLDTQLELLEHLLNEPFFDSLRTKQQLGYVVAVGARRTFGILVISSSHSVAEVQEAISIFVKSIPSLLISLEESLFNSHIEALIKDKRKPLSSLFDAAGVAWSEIDENTFIFDSQEKQALLLGSDLNFNKESMLAFSINLLDIKTRRLLIIQSSSSQQEDIKFYIPLSDNSRHIHVQTSDEIHNICSLYKNLV